MHAEWQPIETAPKNMPVLACIAGMWTFLAMWNKDPSIGVANHWWRVSPSPYGAVWLGPIEPTHWMPIPPPPEPAQ